MVKWFQCYLQIYASVIAVALDLNFFFFKHEAYFIAGLIAKVLSKGGSHRHNKKAQQT